VILLRIINGIDLANNRAEMNTIRIQLFVIVLLMALIVLRSLGVVKNESDFSHEDSIKILESLDDTRAEARRNTEQVLAALNRLDPKNKPVKSQMDIYSEEFQEQDPSRGGKKK
jgi:hypothetical protein